MDTEAVLQFAVTNNWIAEDQLAAVRSQLQEGADLETALVKSGVLDEEQLAQAQAQALGIPYIDLREIQIQRDVLGIIPESTARGHMIIAYEDTPEALKVGMADPGDRQIVEFIHKKVDKPVMVSFASSGSVREALALYQESLEADLKNLIEEARGSVTSKSDLSEIAEDLPIVKITEAILKHAILQEASDIHIEPLEKRVIVRYRVDGILHDMLVLPKVMLTGLVARIKVLSRLKIDEHRLPQDGRFKIETEDYKVAFRVSILPVFDGEKIVMRLLDESGAGLGLEDVGMNEKALGVFNRNISKPHGMVLVTGPTGSGKTTTLYAALRKMNVPDVNISTIEDPIEYRMERINQTQVQPKIGLTFATGLRSLVRQDPDIIMVGEIRDEETASLAVNAALTGHLVLSTLHTNSASGAVPRLLDMDVEPFLIASTANLLLAQRLVRKLCEDCRKEGEITEAMLETLKIVIDTDELLAVLKREGAIKEGEDWPTLKVFTPVGCKKCSNGYKRRVGIYEVLEVTPSIQKLISGNVTAKELENAAREEQQMVSMFEDGIMKVLHGLTSLEEVLRVAKE